MDGSPFLGKGTSPGKPDREQLSFSYADRFDEKYDLVRAVRVGDYKYIRNYQPFNIDALQNNYRYRMLAYTEWRSMFYKSQLNEEQSMFFRKKPAEALFNVSEDPYELNNLADDPDYASIKSELREALMKQLISMPDLSFYPESYLVANALDNPVQFGNEHREDIQELVEVADMALSHFEEVRDELLIMLDSDNDWKRYWALIVCSSFEAGTPEIVEKITEISENDQEPLNRLRALEYLALKELSNAGQQIKEEIIQSEDPVEVLLMLNTLALLKDIGSPSALTINDSIVHTWSEIPLRLEYLKN
jgi:hypothetical protein